MEQHQKMAAINNNGMHTSVATTVLTSGGKVYSILCNTTTYSKGGHNTAHAGYWCSSRQFARQQYSGNLQAQRGRL